MSGIRLSPNAFDPLALKGAQQDQARAEEKEQERSEDAKRLQQLMRRPSGAQESARHPAEDRVAARPLPKPAQTGIAHARIPPGGSAISQRPPDALQPQAHQAGLAAPAAQQSPPRRGTTMETEHHGKSQTETDTVPTGAARGVTARRIQEEAEHSGGGTGGGGSQDGQGEQRGQPGSAVPLRDFQGDAILAGLGPSPEVRSTAAETRSKELAGLITEITDRIIAGERGGIPELRATLRGDLWDRTELQITWQNGVVEVTIRAGNAASNELLLRNGNDLANHLARSLDTAVVVKLAPDQNTAHSQGAYSDDGEQNRRSRGLDDLIIYAAGA